MGKYLDAFAEAFNDLPWVIKGIMYLTGIDLFHRLLLHTNERRLEGHTHDNNGVAVVPPIWEEYRTNR
tara:strand:+ start:88 stop:291 length:204 start_codon:yes stop_codon:yes gene_type:complete